MLKARGLTINDEQKAGCILGVVSYFRLANYLRPMEADKETHQYKLNSTFENAVALYQFDTDLREIVFRAISYIEIALRSKMIHHFSLKYGAFWFTDMSICNDEHIFLENLNAVDREVRRSKEDYIKEHFSKYKDSAFPPAWKAMELLSLGTLAKLFFNACDTKIKKKIAREFGLPNHLAPAVHHPAPAPHHPKAPVKVDKRHGITNHTLANNTPRHGHSNAGHFGRR